MFSHQVNRTDADKVFTVVHNVDGDSITTGMGARYLGSLAAEAASADGISAGKIASADDAGGRMLTFAGVATQDIPTGEYGLVQSWGLCDSVLISNHGTSVTIGIIDEQTTLLKPGALGGSFTSSAVQDCLSVGVQTTYLKMQTLDTVGLMSASTYGTKVFIRAI